MNIEEHFVGYLYIMDLINEWKMEIIKMHRNLYDNKFPHVHLL
jgi:hypothetical protein